jgi:hypothetical protein
MNNSLVRVLFEPIWSTLVLPLFFINTVIWDLARFLVESPDLQESSNKRKDISKRLRRKQTRAGKQRTTWLPVMFFFISTWGIMTGSVMLSKEFYQGHTPEHPFYLVNQQLAGTYTRMEALDRLLVLSPGVLLQYQKIQAHQLWLEMRPKQVKSNECEKQEEIDRHFDEFCYTYQESPFQIDEYEKFLDCPEDIPICETRQDPLDLDSLYLPRYTVICSTDPTETNCGSTEPAGGKDTDTAQNDMSAHLTHVPTNQATQMLVIDDWMFAFAAKKPFESRAPVVFDTGASLAITSNQHDVVEPPTLLSRPMTLGGMENDLEIKGIGTVAWTFDAADGSEIQLLTQA